MLPAALYPRGGGKPVRLLQVVTRTVIIVQLWSTTDQVRRSFSVASQSWWR